MLERYVVYLKPGDLLPTAVVMEADAQATIAALQQRVAQLEGELSTPTWVCDGCGRVSSEGWINIVNETLDGIDYDMECPSCGVRQIEEDSAADLVSELERREEQLTTLQADHATLMGLVRETVEFFESNFENAGLELCGLMGGKEITYTGQRLNELIKQLAASLPAQGGAPVYSEEDLKKWWVAKCPKCGWEGLTRDCGGGRAIADTGDFDDPTCPKCDTIVE